MEVDQGLRRRRLAWACRRGMLELDEILSPLAARSASLDDEVLSRAERLLEHDDYELWEMLINRSELPREYAGLLVEK